MSTAIGTRLLGLGSSVGRNLGPIDPDTDSDSHGRPDDIRREVVAGAAVMLAFFGGLVGWAALAPLDAAVVAPAVVVVSGDRQSVQHRDGGIISKIAVKEGERVARGDILLELAATEVLAQEQAAASQLIDLQLQRAQFLAEAAGAREIQKPPEWVNLQPQDEPIAEAAFARYQQEMRSRRAASSAQAGFALHGSADLDARITGYRQEIQSIGKQENLLQEELTGMRELAASQLVPLPRVRELERSVAALEGRRAELRAAIAQAQQQKAEDLRTVEAKISVLAPQLTGLQAQLEQARIRAPVSGSIVGLTVHTVGGVIKPGETLMDIVPEQQPLVVEAQVPPRDADQLRLGMETEVKITAFSGRNLPIVHGKVSRVSADRFIDDLTGKPFFKIQVEVSPKDLETLHAGPSGSERRLRAGLPAEVVVPTRKRTALQYIFEPLTQTIWRSFRER